MEIFTKRVLPITYIIILILLHIEGRCQLQRLVFENSFEIVDTTEYEFLYKLEFVDDISKPTDKLIDKQVLQIGSNYSFYFSKLLYINDSINTIREETDAKTLLSQPEAAASYEILTNKKTKHFEVSYRSDDVVFHYKEIIPQLNWVIHENIKIVQKYTCQKATTKFRGREYEAWFTSEIPIPEGPYKFGGLPGMILEIHDSENHFFYKCIGIKKTKQPIRYRKWKYTELSRQELHKFLTKKYNNISGYYKSRGTVMWIRKDSKFIEAPDNYKLPYNPIELE